MNNDQSSISIINKNNGQIIGEQAVGLPVIIRTSFSWMKIFIAGCVCTSIVLIAIFFLAKTQVQVVEIVGKSNDFQILELK